MKRFWKIFLRLFFDVAFSCKHFCGFKSNANYSLECRIGFLLQIPTTSFMNCFNLLFHISLFSSLALSSMLLNNLRRHFDLISCERVCAHMSLLLLIWCDFLAKSFTKARLHLYLNIFIPVKCLMFNASYNF